MPNKLPSLVPETLPELEEALEILHRLYRQKRVGPSRRNRIVMLIGECPGPNVAGKWWKELRKLKKDEIFDEEREARRIKL